MKKLILIPLIALCANSFAGSLVKDTVAGTQYLPIQDVTIIDKKACRLTVRGIGDNFYNAAVFYYELLDSTNAVLYGANVTVSGNEYTEWNANDNESPYFIVARIKNFIVK